MNTSIHDRLMTVSIASIINSGAGFGVVIGTGANCIIPSRVLHAADLRVGDLISCRLIDNPNEEYRMRTPFMVAYVDPYATAALRRAIDGEAPVPAEPASEPEQLSLPFAEALKEMLELPVAAPAPKPEAIKAADVRARVEGLLDSGGIWNIKALQTELWPDEDMDTKDYRYKMLSNCLRDLHISGAVAAVGRRTHMRGSMTKVHYTKFLDRVQFVWTEQ